MILLVSPAKQLRQPRNRHACSLGLEHLHMDCLQVALGQRSRQHQPDEPNDSSLQLPSPRALTRSQSFRSAAWGHCLASHFLG